MVYSDVHCEFEFSAQPRARIDPRWYHHRPRCLAFPQAPTCAKEKIESFGMMRNVSLREPCRRRQVRTMELLLKLARIAMENTRSNGLYDRRSAKAVMNGHSRAMISASSPPQRESTPTINRASGGTGQIRGLIDQEVEVCPWDMGCKSARPGPSSTDATTSATTGNRSYSEQKHFPSCNHL